MTIVRKKKFFKALAVCAVTLMFSASTLVNAEAVSVAYPDGDASATGVNSTAVGSGAKAEGNLSTAVGYNAQATATSGEGTAIGNEAKANVQQ